jgi:hypothetical protein
MSKPLGYWMTSLLVTTVLASGITAWAQGRPTPRPGEPRVLAGPDVGFRIDGTDPRNGRPTGTLVVRINGQWVETSAVPGVQLAK